MLSDLGWLGVSPRDVGSDLSSNALAPTAGYAVLTTAILILRYQIRLIHTYIYRYDLLYSKYRKV